VILFFLFYLYLNPTPTQITTVKYTSKYLEGSIPTGWTIKEFENGQGTDKLVEGNFQGLTSVKIYNEQNTEVFSVTAIWGVGGTPDCDQIYKFKDTPQGYIDEKKQLASDVGNSGSKVVSLGDNYTEYTVLGAKTRSLAKYFYWDDVYYEAQYQSFIPACGISESAVTFKDISYQTNGTKLSDYTPFLDKNISEQDFTKLEAVLKSLQAK
jgi:hypothetical protein